MLQDNGAVTAGDDDPGDSVTPRSAWTNPAPVGHFGTDSLTIVVYAYLDIYGKLSIELEGVAAGKLKPIIWVRSSKEDLKRFPDLAQKHIGFALKMAQMGEKHLDAKPMRGFGGASVIEVVEDYDRNTYRAVYTVRFAEVICVLHCFQKKSRHGIATVRRDIDLIKERLARAEELHRQRIV